MAKVRAEGEEVIDTELERVAEWLRDSAERPSAIARALGLDVYLVPNLLGRGQLSRFHGRQIISVRASLSLPYREHTIGHELAHWAGVECEASADYVGAAIMLPRSIVSHDFRVVAKVCKTTETSALLRFAEVHSEPVTIAGHRIHVRGEDLRGQRGVSKMRVDGSRPAYWRFAVTL